MYARRSDEVTDLLDAVAKLALDWIKTADGPSPSHFTVKGKIRPVLVDSKTPQDLTSLLSLDLPQNGAGKAGLMRLVDNIFRYSVNTWDQGFMDKLYASTNAVGVVTELILGVLNTNVHVYQVSPVLTIVEKHVTRSLAELFGFTSPHAGGIVQPGGSASNASSISIARNTLFPQTKTHGIGSERYVLFTSAHGHYSLEKAAQLQGFGSNNVRSVPVDRLGQMRPDALRQMIAESKRLGEVPFYVNATAGTTVLGSYDPIKPIADICEEFGLWLHVDGSWGGAVVFNDEIKRGRLDGIERANSITMNPHKMLGAPVTCSFLLGKDMRQFWKAMTLPAGYLFHNEDADDINDLADLTPNCGRRGDALKLHLQWLYYGTAGLSQRIGSAFGRAQEFLDILSRSKDIIVASPQPLPCLQVCFYYAPDGVLPDDELVVSKQTAAIVARLVQKGFMIDYAPGDRGKLIRVVINADTTSETVHKLAADVQELGKELVAQP